MWGKVFKILNYQGNTNSNYLTFHFTSVRSITRKTKGGAEETDRSAADSIGCSYRACRSVPSTTRGSQPSVAAVPQDPTLPPALVGRFLQTHPRYTNSGYYLKDSKSLKYSRLLLLYSQWPRRPSADKRGPYATANSRRSRASLPHSGAKAGQGPFS